MIVYRQNTGPTYTAERGPSVFNLALAGAAVMHLPLRRLSSKAGMKQGAGRKALPEHLSCQN